MQRYDSYKDSGIQWLGEIPSHWEMQRTKYIWRETDTRSENGSEQLLSVSQYDGVRESKSDSRSESLKGYKLVKQSELVINIMLAWLGGLGVSKYEGLVSPAYCVYKLISKQNPYFLHYLYRTPMYLSEFARRSSGIVPSRWRMYSDDFGEVLTLLPPLPEQQAIASYLDKATAKIDEAIAQQQKMIDLLNERKQIIINNAVTKGLNPNAKMKPSGIDWIGTIPKHWEVTKLKSIGTTINGVSHDSSYFGEGFPFVSYSDVYKNRVLPQTVGGLAKSSKAEQKFFSVEAGDVFFTRTSETVEEIGISSTCINTIPNAVFAGFLIRFRPVKGVLDSNFSSFYFRAQIHRSYFVKEMNLVIRASLSQQLLKGLPVLLPPVHEQVEIAQYLSQKTSMLEQAITAHNQQITLLQERKQIIINDVVTGKVKVS